MLRWLLWIIAGTLLGGIVHLITVLLLPRSATLDAYSRLVPLAPVNTMAAVPAPSAKHAVMPYMDPAFATAVCRYDLAKGPIKLTAPVRAAYTSATFYTRRGVAYYAINDRAAGRSVIELELMTSAQRAELPEDEDITAADRLIVESPTETGLIVLRALAPEPSLMAKAEEALAAAKCETEEPAPQR